jgi:hypothetical protein
MSLWLAVIWLVCAAICIAVFGLCRKRMADVAQQVAEEVENGISKILKSERDAEARLLEAFTGFENPAEAIRTYQKIMTEVFPCPQANPPWNWTRDDLEIWRNQLENRNRANCSRSTVLTTVIIILALNIAAAVTTVIMLNNVPVLSATVGTVGTSGVPIGQLPQPISVPPQLTPVPDIPLLPTTNLPIPTDNILDKTQSPDPNLDSNNPNTGTALDEKLTDPNNNDRITGGFDTSDQTKFPDNQGSSIDTSKNDSSSVSPDIDHDVEPIPDCNTTEPSDSQSKGPDNE